MQTYFRLCPLCHAKMHTLWAMNYDFMCSAKYLKGWRCPRCRSEHSHKVHDKLTAFVPKVNTKRNQEIIREMESQKYVPYHGDDAEDDEIIIPSDTTTRKRSISEPRACPTCSHKLFVISYNTYRSMADMVMVGWECPACMSSFSKKSADLLPSFVDEREEDTDSDCDDDDCGCNERCADDCVGDDRIRGNCESSNCTCRDSTRHHHMPPETE